MVANFEVSFANVDAIAASLSKEVIAELAEQSEAKARIKRGAAWLMFYLTKDWGEDIMSSFPPVGSKHKPGSNAVTDMNPEDYIKADGTKGERQVSIYAKVWDVSEAGQQHQKHVKAWQEKKDTALDEQSWDNEMSRLTQVRVNEINKLKEAFKLYQKIERVNDYIGDAKAELQMNDNGDEPIKGHKSVLLRRVEGPPASKAFTVGAFLALNIDSAIKSGGTYAALVATVGKGSKPPTTFISTIEKVTQWDEVTAEYSAYLDRIVSDSKKYKDAITHLNEAGSDDMLLSLDNIYQRLETILGTPANEKRLRELHENGGRKGLTARRQANAA